LPNLLSMRHHDPLVSGCGQGSRSLQYINIYLFMLRWRIVIMTATNPYGQDYRPRKKSTMYCIPQALIIGGIVCLAVMALVAALYYGTEGHSAP
jgi:multisubunit Na+/H+ antiporter MnhC subunit